MAEEVELEVADGVATVRLNRPEALNALTRPMGRTLRETIERCATAEDVRAVVVSGAGRAFCSGADVTQERPRTPEGELDLGSGLNQIFNGFILSLRSIPKPVIAAVNGAAAGVGASIACACDLVLAADSAYFLLAFARVGLVPDGGISLTLQARVGLGRALEMAMLADRVPAADALAWGLVNEVCPGEELADRAQALARRLADGPVGAYAEIKRLFNRRLLPELETQLGVEAAAQFRRGLSPEYAEGVRAFAEKRAPDFRHL